MSDLHALWKSLKTLSSTLDTINSGVAKVSSLASTFFCEDTFDALLAMTDLCFLASSGSSMPVLYMSGIVRLVKTRVFSQMMNRFPEVSRWFPETPQLQSQGSSADYMNRLANSSLSLRCTALVGLMFSSSLFANAGVAGRFALSSFVGRVSGELKTGQFIFALFDFLQELVVNAKLALESGNFSDLFGKDPVIASIAVMDSYAEILRGAGRSELSNSEGSDLSEMLIYETKLASLSLRKEFSENINFVSARKEFLSTLNAYKRAPKLNPAVQTVGIIVTGPPGTGKSDLARLIEDGERVRRKVAPGVDIAIHYRDGHKHQQVNGNASIFIGEDVFTTNDQNCPNPSLSFMQSLVEGHPVALEAASIEDKRMCESVFNIVYFSTNSTHFNFSQSGSGFDKLDRRYYVVERSYSPWAKKKAVELGIDISRYYEWKHSEEYDGTMDGISEFVDRIGWMKSSPTSSVVQFTISKLLTISYSPEETAAWFNARAVEAIAVSKKRCAQRINHCPHGNPSPTEGVCGDFCFRTREKVRPIQESPDGAVLASRSGGDFDAKLKALDAEIEAFERLRPQGLAISRMVLGDPIHVAAAIAVLGNPFKWMSHVTATWKLSDVIQSLALISVAFAIVNATRALSTSGQGNVQAPLAGRESDAPTPVEPFRARLPPYVTTTARCSDVVVIGLASMSMHALFLTPEIFATARHLFDRPQVKRGEIISLARTDGSRVSQVFDPDRLYTVHSSQDICFYFYGIHASGPNGVIHLVKNRPDTTWAGTFKGKDAMFIEGPTSELIQGRGVVGEMGDCGKPYFRADGSVAAIHVRGNPSIDAVGGTPIDLKSFDAAKRFFESKGFVTLLPETHGGKVIDELLLSGGEIKKPGDAFHFMDSLTAVQREEMDLQCLGKRPYADKQAFTAKKSTIYPFFQELTTKTWRGPHPGHALESAGWVSPVTAALYHPRGVLLTFFAEAVQDALSLSPAKNVVRAAPLSFTQAVVGEPDNSLIGPIRDDTGIGRHLRMQNLKKEQIFTKNAEGETVVHAAFMERYSEIEGKIFKGERCMTIVDGTVKNEVLDESAVLERGKGRIFNVVEKPLNVCVKRHVRVLCSLLAMAWEDTGCSHIINASGKQWDRLARLHLAVGDLSFDGDFTYYDKSHGAAHSHVVQFFYLYALKVGMTPDEALIAARLLVNCLRGIVVVEGFIFFMQTRLFSGLDITLIYNSIVNWILLLAWLRDRSEAARLVDSSFVSIDLKKELRQDKTGDDNLTTLSNRLSSNPVFHPESFKEFAARCGYGLTSADKEATLRWKPLSQCQYLKRTFAYSPEYGLWMGPLESNSIVKALCMTLEKVATRERDTNTWRCMEKESFLHGREFYSRLQELAVKAGLPTLPYEKHEVDYVAGRLCTWCPTDMDVSWESQGCCVPKGRPRLQVVHMSPRPSSIDQDSWEWNRDVHLLDVGLVPEAEIFFEDGPIPASPLPPIPRSVPGCNFMYIFLSYCVVFCSFVFYLYVSGNFWPFVYYLQHVQFFAWGGVQDTWVSSIPQNGKMMMSYHDLDEISSSSIRSQSAFFQTPSQQIEASNASLSGVSDYTNWKPNLTSFGLLVDVNFCPTQLNSTMKMVEPTVATGIDTINKPLAPLVEDSQTAASGFSALRIPATPFDLKQIAAIPRQIGTFTWTNATALQNIQVWPIFCNIGPLNKMITTQVNLCRGAPRITLQYTGSPNFMGIARIFAVPQRETDISSYENGSSSSDLITTYLAYPKFAGYPHVDIDASLTCVCKLDLPYVSVNDFNLSGSGVNDWTLYFAPMSTLLKTDTTATTGLTVSVQAHYEEFEVLGLRAQGRETDGPISSWLDYGADMGSRFISPLIEVARKGAKVARSMGFSRQPEEASSVVVSRKNGNFSAVSGVGDQVTHMGLDPMQQYNVETTHLPGGHLADTFMDFMRRYPSQLAMPLNFTLGVLYTVTPEAMALNSTDPFYPTPIGFVASCFRYYTGSMKVRFVVNSSPLVRVRYGINVIPPGIAGPGAYVSNGSVFGQIVEVVGSTEFTVDVPYLYYSKFTQLNAQYVAVNSDYGTRIIVFAIEGPNSTTDVVNPPGISMYYEVGDDFEFSRPHTQGINQWMMQGLSSETFGGEVNSFEELAKRSCYVGTISPDTGFTALNACTISLPVDGFVLNHTTAPTSVNALGPNATSNIRWTDCAWSFHRFFACHTLGYTGSSTWRGTVSNASATVGQLDATSVGSTVRIFSGGKSQPGLGFYQTSQGTGYLLNYNRADAVQNFPEGIFEFSIPDWNMGQFKVTATGGFRYLGGPPAQTFTISTYPYVPTNGIAVSLYHGASDDVRYGMYMPPTWKLRT